MCWGVMQEREAAADRENRLQGKNRLLRSGQYRLQGEKRADAKSIASLHSQATLLTAQVRHSLKALLPMSARVCTF